MSQAIISNNTTIKISATVSSSRSTSGVLYTCPANSYAIIQCGTAASQAGGSSAITLAGLTISYSSSSTFTPLTYGVYVGPGQVVSAVMGLDQYGNLYNMIAVISGVQFTNSP